MKKTAILLATSVAAIGLGISSAASADEYLMKLAGTETPLAATEAPIEDIDVTASRLLPGTPVAVSGTVDEISRSGFIINSMAGPVKVTTANKFITTARGTTPVSHQLMVGDSVTAFGKLRHGDVVGVTPKALLLQNSAPKAQLIVMEQEKLQSMQKLNTSINGKTALRALQNSHREL